MVPPIYSKANLYGHMVCNVPKYSKANILGADLLFDTVALLSDFNRVCSTSKEHFEEFVNA